jgi:hypothetical protein
VVYGLFGGFQAGSSYSSIGTMPDNAIIVGAPGASAFGNKPDQLISTLTGYASSIGGNINGSVTISVNNAWISANSSTGSWAGYQYGGPGTVYNSQGASAYGFYSGTLETQVGNVLNVNTIYDSGTGLNNGYVGANIGTLSLGSDGSVNFNTVPEPSTYALFGFGALLLVIAYRRKTA